MTLQHQLIPMGPGERLRFERETRKLSIAESAAQTHLSEEIITALEADELKGYAPVYIKGYLTTYARFLGIGNEDIASLLADARHGEEPLQTVFPHAQKNQPGDRWLRATSYVLASLLVGTLAWQFTHEAVRLSQGKDQTAMDAAQPGNHAGSPENRETHINASIASLEKIPASNGSRTGTAGQQAWAALSSRQASIQLGEGEHVLDLRSSADSWVEISDASGKLLEQDLVRGGESRTYRGIAPFKLTFGRSSAIELAMDGHAVDLAPFTLEDVTQMTLAADDPATTDAEQVAGAGPEDE